MTLTPRIVQHVDPAALKNDLTARVAYLKSFLNFTDDDGAAIQSSAGVIAPALPAVLDAIYTHLISYDITSKAFAQAQPEQNNSDGKVADVSELSLNHPNILHRKDFLKAYFVKLVSNSDWSNESPFWNYLDKVGLMHTGEPGFKHRQKRPQLRIEVMHVSLLLGFVEEIVLKATLGADDLDLATKTTVISAFNKLLWIQNDLFQKHYVTEASSL
jgi:hypothetical protein